jgi:hypothetical protein
MMVERDDEAAKGDGQSRDIFEARIIGRIDELDRLLRSVPLDVGCTHPHFDRLADGNMVLFAYATVAQVEQLRGRGHRVELGENVSQRAERRKGEIGVGDRFAGGKIAPKGLGRKLAAGELQ